MKDLVIQCQECTWQYREPHVSGQLHRIFASAGLATRQHSDDAGHYRFLADPEGTSD